MTAPAQEIRQEVRRRRVFYLPGFDPHPDARYHRLFRDEGARQAKIGGYALEVGPAVKGDGRTDWSAHYRDSEGREVQTQMRVWSWRDLVASRMSQPLWRRLARGYRAYAGFILSGDVVRLGRLARTPQIPMLYPLLVVNFCLLAALAAGVAVLWGALWLTAKLGAPSLNGWLAGLALGAGAGGAVLQALRKRERRVFGFYLFDCYALMQEHARGGAPALEARLESFAEDLAEASRSGEYDEILVVGHSLGAPLVVEALARGFRRDPDLAKRRATVGLLTLGQILTAFTALGGGRGEALREAGRAMAARDDLTWVDVTSQADGACYALVDPLAGSRAPPSAERRAGPKLISGRFRETMDAAEYARLRRKWNRLHFQYLYVFGRPGAFEYFAICAGPLSLKSRFAQVKSSRHAPPLAAETSPETAARAEVAA